MNRFWGRNDDSTSPKLSRDENQLLALNYENLCDADYLNRLFLPPSTEIAVEGNPSYQDVLVQTPTRDHESWILVGDTAEDIIVFGGDSALGSAFLEKRFMRDVASVLKLQDTLSSLVYRQVVVFDHIGKLIVAKCNEDTECLKVTTKQKLLSDSLAGASDEAKGTTNKKHLASEILACALSSLERQSRTNLRRSAVEPIISLLVNMFQDHAKLQGRRKGSSAEGTSPKNKKSEYNLVVLGPTHAHLLREILCNGISRGMEFLCSDGLASIRLGRSGSFRDQEEALKLCQCCAYGLLALGVYTASPSDIFMAIFHLTALSVLSEELQDELTSYQAEENDKQLRNSVADLSLNPSMSPTHSSVLDVESVSTSPTKMPSKMRKTEGISNGTKPVVGAFPKSVGAATVTANNKTDSNPKKLRIKGQVQGPQNNSAMTNIDLGLSDGPNTDSRSLLVPSEETYNSSQQLPNGKEDVPKPSKWEKPNQKAALPAEKESNGKSKIHLGKNKGALTTELIDEANVTTVNYLTTHDHRSGVGLTTTGAKHQGTPSGKELPNGKLALRAKNNNQLKVGKMPASSVMDVASKEPAMKAANNTAKLAVPMIPLHEVISPIQSASKRKLSERALTQILQTMHRVPKTVLRIVQDGSAVLQTANGQGAHSPAMSAYKSLIASKSYVWSCGQNSYGELGHGDVNQRKVFTKISCLEGKGIISVGAGNEHSVFVTKEGKVLVTGYNDNGQCGVGNNQQVKQPTLIQALEGEEIANVHVYNGCEHTLAVTKDGKLYSFGYNYRGQLGHGSTTSENVPRLVKGLMSRKVLLAACSYHHSVMLCADGAVFTCGRNDCGQLGLGDMADKKVPQLVPNAPRDVIGLSCGQYHTVLLTESGIAYLCGKNDYGQLGLEGVDNVKVFTKAVITPESDGIKNICCGYYHSLFLSHNGIVSGFGRNDYGQLGLGHTQTRVHRSQVVTSLRDKNVVSISAGCYHSVAVTCNGMLYVFGRNNHGQLGTGDLEERDLPHPVDDFVGCKIVSVAAGFYHTLVLAVDASVDIAPDIDILEDSEPQATCDKTVVATTKEVAGEKLLKSSFSATATGATAGASRTMTTAADKVKSNSSNPITARRVSNSHASSLSAALFAGIGPSPLADNGMSQSARKSLDALQDAVAAAANFGMDRNVSSAQNVIIKGFSMENRSKSATIRELLAYLVMQLETQVLGSSPVTSPETPAASATTAEKSTEDSPSPAQAKQLSWLIRQLRAISMMLELVRHFLHDSVSNSDTNTKRTQIPFAPDDALSLMRTLIRTAAHFLHANRPTLAQFLDDDSETSKDGANNTDSDDEEDSAGIFSPPQHRALRSIDIIRDVHAAAAAVSAAASPVDHVNSKSSNHHRESSLPRTDSFEGCPSLADSTTARSCASSIQSATATHFGNGGVAPSTTSVSTANRRMEGAPNASDVKSHVTRAVARLRQELLYAYFYSPLVGSSLESKENPQLQQMRQSTIAEAASTISKCYELLFPSFHVRAQLFGMLSQVILSCNPGAQVDSTAENAHPAAVVDYHLALRLFTRVSFKYRNSHEVIKLFRCKRQQGLVIFQNMLSVYNHLSLYALECHARKAVISNNGDINRALATLEHCNASFVKCAIPLIFANQSGAQDETAKGKQWLDFGITIIKEHVFLAAENVMDLIAEYAITEDVMHVLRYGTVIPSVLPSILMYGISNSRSEGCIQELLPLVRSLTRKLQSLGSASKCSGRYANTAIPEGGAAPASAAASPSKRSSGIVTKNGTTSGAGLSVIQRGFGRGDEDLSDAAIVAQGPGDASTVAAAATATVAGGAAATAATTKKEKDPNQVSWCSRLLKLSTILSAKLASSLIHDDSRSIQGKSESPSESASGPQRMNSITNLPVWNYVACPPADVLHELDRLPSGGVSNNFIAMATSAEVSSICAALRAREATVDATYRMLQQAAKASKMQNIIHNIENVLFAAFISTFGSSSLTMTLMSTASGMQPMLPPQMNTFFTSTWTAIAKLTKTIQSRRSQLLNRSEGGLDWQGVLDVLYRVVVVAAQLMVKCPPLLDIGAALTLPRKSKYAAFRRACMIIICVHRWAGCRRLRVKSLGVFMVEFVTSVIDITTKSLTSIDSAEDVEKRWQASLTHLKDSSARVDRFADGVRVITETLDEAVYNSMRCDVLAILILAWRESLSDEHASLCCSREAANKKTSAVSNLVAHVCGVVQDFATTFQGSYAAATAGDFTLFSLALKFIQLLNVPPRSSICSASIPLQAFLDMLKQLRSVIISLDEKVFENHSPSVEEKSLVASRNANGKVIPRDRSKTVRRAANSIIALIQQLAISESLVNQPVNDQLGFLPSATCSSPASRSLLAEVHCDLLHYFQKARIAAAKASQDLEANSSGKGDKDAKNSKDNSKRRCQDIITKPMEFCRSQEGFVIQGDKLLNNYKGIDFTLAVWVFFTKKTTARHGFITGKLSHHDAWPLIALRSDGKLDVIYGHSSELERMTSAASIPLTTWTHLAVVVEPKKIKLFINGVLDAQTGTKGNSRAVLFPVVVGSCPQGVRTHVDQARVGFDGLLALYKYYTRALSPIHVRVVFDQGPPEAHDRRERWGFQLLASFRILLENGRLGLFSDRSVRLAAEALQMLFVTDTSGRLRCGALRLLDEVLRADRVSDMRIFENRGITVAASNSADINGGGLVTSVPITECPFLSEAPSFKERLMLYFVRIVGACWSPTMIVSSDEASAALLTELTQRPKGAAAADLDRDARITELMLFAPAVLGDKSPRPSSSSFAAGPGSAAALDRLAAREDATGELSFHVITTLRNLVTVESWRSALSNVLTLILENCCKVVNDDAEWTPGLTYDILGAAAVLGESSCGPHLGAAVESYFSDRSCRILNIFKATNNAILLSWNAEASKRQLSTVRLGDLKTCSLGPFAHMTPQLVFAMVGAMDALKKYAQLTISDLLAVYRPDHAFSRFTLLRSLRPMESLIFHQLLRSISLLTDDHLVIACAEAFDSFKPLYSNILQACARAMWLQSSDDDVDTQAMIPNLWNRSARYIVAIPQKTVMCEFPPIESDRVFMDYVNKHLGIAVESFQSTPYEKLLKQGLISEVVFSNATGSARLGDNSSASNSSKDSPIRDQGSFLLLPDDKFPMTDWTGVTPFGSSFNVRSIITGAVSGELSELDSAAALRLMYHIRRSIIISARHAMTGPLRLLSAANYAALPLQWKAVLWHGLAPFTCRQQVCISSGNFCGLEDDGAKPSGMVTSAAKADHSVTSEMFQVLQANHRVEFTVSLASSLRYSAISLKNSGSVLESSDLFMRLLSGAELWLDLHEGNPAECDLCYHLLRMILPSLLFVKSSSLELKMMMLCRRALNRLILRLLAGYEPSKELLDLAKSNNFTLLRARAQEQLSLQKGYIRSDFNPFAHNLTQLVAGLEILQRHAASFSSIESRSLLASASTTSLLGAGRSTGAAASTPQKSGTANAQTQAPIAVPQTTAPRMVTVQSTSIEADLHACVLSAINAFKERETLLAANAVNNATMSPRSPSVSLLEAPVTTPAAAAPASPSSGAVSAATAMNTAAATVAAFTESLLVEVALGVQSEGEECHFETIYCGNSLRFMQAGLLPGCVYLLKCRASAGGYMLDWSTPLEFRTESGVFFAFDPLKCGPDIQLGDDGLTASYTGDDSWSTLLGTQSFSSGVVSWEVRVTQSSTAYVFIGVATAAADLNTFLGGCPNGWGFIGEQALYHNRENVKGYGEAFNAGDVIGVVLNFHNGTISFSRNGKMLGVAFDKIYGELYPAVAFYNMGQELEIIPEGFQTSCPHEPTPCSPARLNLNSISMLSEMLFCINTGAPFSSRVLALVAEHCAEWSFSKLTRVKVLTGKQMFISIDEQAPLLVKYGLGIGERVRTPFGLAEVVGTAHNRLWFRFKDTSHVWFFTHTQIAAGREKGLFMRCSYETSSQSVAAVPDFPSGGTSTTPAGIAAASPAATSLSLLKSPERASASKIPAPNVHFDRVGGAGGFDVASLQEMLEPGRWSGDMDAALVAYLVRLSDATSVSPWTISCDRVLEDFRSLQQQLTRIVLGSVELTHRWGIAGPKRKAVIARIGFLRFLNHQLDVYLPALLLDTSGESLTMEKRTQDEFNPVLTSIKAARTAVASSLARSSSAPALPAPRPFAKIEGSTDHMLHLEDSRNPNAAALPAATQVSTSWSPLSTSKLLNIGPLPATRYRIFPDLKMTYFWEIVARSAARPAKTDDDYDYPEDLPQVKINRFKSFRAREAAELMGIPGEDLQLSSMFCQLWRELSVVNPEKLRISYTHPMDDGQARTFKVRFEGEGVDDYGGPYREIFQLICDELLQSDPSVDFPLETKSGQAHPHAPNSLSPTRRAERSHSWGAADTAGPSEDNSKPTKKPACCFLPLLHPTPNWTASNCTERYRYMFHPDASSPLRLDLFKFLGQVVGIAVRSKITLELPLASYIWKCVVREPLDERDIASFDAPAADFVMRLGTIHKRLTVLRDASKLAKESVADITDQANANPMSPSLQRNGSRNGIPTISTPSRPTSARGASPAVASITTPSTPAPAHATPSTTQKIALFTEESDLSHETIPALTSEAEALIQDLTWIATRSDGQVVELVPGGASRPVQLHEIGEYLQLYVEARLSEGAAAIRAFVQGLLSIVPESSMILLGWEELEKIICGSRTIDIDRLKANTEYDDDVTANDTHIVQFWEVLNEFSEEEKSAFLRFVWARPTLPPKGVDFPQKMKVQSAVGDDAQMKPDQYLPKAHTCFFSINLPRYSSKELMAEKLRYAIIHCTEMDADFRLTDTDVAGWGLVSQPTWSSMTADD